MGQSRSRIAWSRLLAEGLVIVVSILLAFAIDTWWDAREDRSKEDSYLRQLILDLEQTLENNARFSGFADARDVASVRLVQAYYEAVSPPRDSIALWLDMVGYNVVQPRLGTVEALVSTGDLALIRDDSLRTAIPNYLTSMQAFEGFEADGERHHQEWRSELSRHVDGIRISIDRISAETRDSIAGSDPLTILPAGPLRDLPEVDLVALIRTPEVHRVVVEMLAAKRRMRTYRELMRTFSENLLERVREAQDASRRE